MHREFVSGYHGNIAYQKCMRFKLRVEHDVKSDPGTYKRAVFSQTLCGSVLKRSGRRSWPS